MTLRREVEQAYDFNRRPFYREDHIVIPIVGYGQQPASPEVVISVDGERVILERVYVEPGGRIYWLN